jgi:phospholipase C
VLPSRRDALRHIGVGLGLGALPAACGFPPTLPEECALNAAERQLPNIAPGRDPAARALLSSIDTFVVVMMENRSFDHLIGSLRFDASYPSRNVINGLTGEEWNMDLDGRPVRVAPMPGRGDGTINPRHQWQYVHQTWNGGRNDGFVRVNAGRGQDEVMGYVVRDQLPFHYALADNFTVCDRWFSSFMGQTWPNRFYLHATTSGGRRENRPLWLNAPPTIWERMALKCHSVKQYAAGPILWTTVGFPGMALSGNTPYQIGGIEDFFSDARTGNLPELSVIDPDFKVSDGCPMHDIRLGDAFLSSIYRAMAESPQWSRSMLIITYDEHGGYFDHVAPPMTADARADFRQLGFRVPAFAIGPTVWSGKVVSTQFEHSSVAATMATRYGIESLGPRMDASADLASCIDPARVGAPCAPPRLFPVELPANCAAELAAAPTSQTEMDEFLDDRAVRAALVDPRSTEERLGSWLRAAQELEAVKLVG